MDRNCGCGSGKLIFLIGGETVERNRPVLEAPGTVTHLVSPLGACRRAWAARTWRPSPRARRAGRGSRYTERHRVRGLPCRSSVHLPLGGTRLSPRTTAESSFPRGQT